MRGARRDARIMRRRARGEVLVPFEALYLLIILAASEGVILFASNLAALKIWNGFGVPVDAGIWFFPLLYVTGDLLVYLYGRKVADLVAYATAAFAFIAVVVLAFAGFLPDFPGADNTAFNIVRSATGRIFCASVVGFLASELANNYVFDRLRQRDSQDHFQKWELLSSLAGRLFDSLLFETLAFAGRLPLTEFARQAIWAYVLGMVFEALMSWIFVKRLARYCRERTGFCDGRMDDEPAEAVETAESHELCDE